MRYLLDTNICIAFLNGKDSKVREKILNQKPTDFALCSIVKAELYFGARKSQNVEANLQLLESFFAPFTSLALDDLASEQYGLIRNQLRAEGKPIGANDLFIAAIALSQDLTLITRNQKEFHRVPSLRHESW